jgi:hypothetical protein
LSRGFHRLDGPLYHFCPCCSQKQCLLFALPHPQFVFTLSKALRVFFRYDPLSVHFDCFPLPV